MGQKLYKPWLIMARVRYVINDKEIEFNLRCTIGLNYEW